jgi:hypothetical protein
MATRFADKTMRKDQGVRRARGRRPRRDDPPARLALKAASRPRAIRRAFEGALSAEEMKKDENNRTKRRRLGVCLIGQDGKVQATITTARNA